MNFSVGQKVRVVKTRKPLPEYTRLYEAWVKELLPNGNYVIWHPDTKQGFESRQWEAPADCLEAIHAKGV